MADEFPWAPIPRTMLTVEASLSIPGVPSAMFSPRPSFLPSLWGGLFLIVALWACGGEDSEAPASVYHPGPGLHQPLALQFVNAPSLTEGSTETLTMDVPESISPWVVHAQKSSIIPIPARDGREAFRALRIEGTSSMRVDIPGSFKPNEFNQIAVTVWCTKKEDFLLILKRKDKAIIKTGGRRVQGSRHPQTILFDIPETGLETAPFHSLSIVFAGRSGRSGLVSISLIQRPWFQWLPSVAEGGELVTMGTASYHAVGLSSLHPLETSFDAPLGSRLSFSFGTPSELRRGGPMPKLRVRVTGQGGAPREEVFSLNKDNPPSWQTGSLNLESLSGPVNASFSLESSKNAESVCALGEVSLQQLGEAPPTVLLITSDTHRADYVGFSGSDVDVRTPFLDVLAKSGVVFEDCATSANVTNPSHVALMTGTHPVQTGVVGNETPLAAAAPTLAEAFREGGFTTWASVSAVHLSHDKSGLGQGFERMSAPERPQRDSMDTIAELIRWLPDAEGQPLFLWLHLFDVHAPYAPPEEWKNMYYPEGANPYDQEMPELHAWASPKWDPRVRDLEYFEALYRSEITYQDDQLGALLELPRFRDALVAFTSDHGESLGDHEVYWDHRELYPNTLMVPLVLVGPNVPSSPEGLRREGAVRQIDLGRTLLDLSGLYGAPFPGTNLLESTNDWDIRYSMAANGTSAALMLKDWFFAIHLKDHRVNSDSDIILAHEVELYNLIDDPRCLVDLSTEEVERARELRQMLVTWLTSKEQMNWTVTRNYQDLEALEQLAALGYTTVAPQRGAQEWINPDCDCERCAAFQ